MGILLGIVRRGGSQDRRCAWVVPAERALVLVSTAPASSPHWGPCGPSRVAGLGRDHLYRALEFLDQGHVKAAAVHVRTKFELVLKWACHQLGLAVKYQPEAHKVPVSDFWAALKGAKANDIPHPKVDRDARGRLVWWQPAPQAVPVVPDCLQKRIEHAVSWVLNPLSHSQTVDR